jgi:hypothetical protein
MGIKYIRRATDDGITYFWTNPTGKSVNQWVLLAVEGRGAVLFDAITGKIGRAATRQTAQRTLKVYLELEPNQSALLKVFPSEVKAPPWPYLIPTGKGRPVEGEWKVEFIEGGEVLPAPRVIHNLESWTDWQGHDGAVLRAFSGTARYTIALKKPEAKADEWILDLGDVKSTARVKLNGKEIATLVARPFRVPLGDALRDGTNTLEIEVSNAMFNRVAALDKPNFGWFYSPTKLTGAPVASGLIGPVLLRPMKNRFGGRS